MDRTPDGETNTPCLRSLLLARVCPYAGSDSKGRDGNLNSLFNSIFQVGLAPADLEQGFNASSVSSGLIPIKGITRKSHYLAGLGNIAKLGGEIEKPGLVFDDVLIELSIRNFRGRGARLMVRLHFHQNGDSLFVQGLTVRSSRN